MPLFAANSADLATSLLAARTVRHLANVLADAGVVTAPLKGVLLQPLVYRHGLRRLRDVDLLVHPGDWERACAALRGAGFRGMRRKWATEVWTHPRWEVPVDLHRSLFAEHLFRLPTHAVFARASVDTDLFGAAVLKLHPFDLYAHLVGHFAKSRLDARDAMHLEDLIVVGPRLGLDAERVAAHLVEVGMQRAARFALRIAAMRPEADFPRRVLAALPCDRGGDVLALVARFVTERQSPGATLPIVAMHGLNSSLPRGARSFTAHAARSLARRVAAEAR